MNDVHALTHKNWLSAAETGNVELLRHWKRTGELDKTHQPSRVKADVPQGRPRPMHFIDDAGNDALHLALRSGKLAYAKTLVDLGAWRYRSNVKGEYPLHFLLPLLAHEETTEASSLLDSFLAVSGDLGASRNERVMRPLSLLVGASPIDGCRCLRRVAEKLIERGAKIDELSTNKAISRRQTGVLELFLERDAPAALAPDNFGAGRLHHLAVNWMPKEDQEGSAVQTMALALLRAGEDPEASFCEKGSTVETSMGSLFSRTKSFEILKGLARQVEAEKLSVETPSASAKRRAQRL